MKITLYTITDCKFSQSEKEYLQSKNIQFEEKNLESNREFLTEMLSISNNFAGTPVTKIEKDDGQVVVLKGFTKDEFDKVLGQTAPVEVQAASVATTSEPAPMQQPVQQPAPVAPQPQIQQPVQPMMPQQPMNQMPQPASQTQVAMPAMNPMPQPIQQPVQTVMPVQQPMQAAPVQPQQFQQAPVAPQSAPSVAPTYQPTQQPMMQTPSEEALSSVLQDLQTKVANEQQQQ